MTVEGQRWRDAVRISNGRRNGRRVFDEATILEWAKAKAKKNKKNKQKQTNKRRKGSSRTPKRNVKNKEASHKARTGPRAAIRKSTPTIELTGSKDTRTTRIQLIKRSDSETLLQFSKGSIRILERDHCLHVCIDFFDLYVSISSFTWTWNWNPSLTTFLLSLFS